jgi:hypothetical protein
MNAVELNLFLDFLSANIGGIAGAHKLSGSANPGAGGKRRGLHDFGKLGSLIER